MVHSIFIETTIPSYYTSRPSRNLLQRARQAATRVWWDSHRHKFDLFVTELVLDESREGEPLKSQERLQLLAGIPLLAITPEVEGLATQLVRRGIFPAVATRDAFHIAPAGVHRVDFLLTWNCEHIANPYIAERLAACFSGQGVYLPAICTPDQFLEDGPSQSQE